MSGTAPNLDQEFWRRPPTTSSPVAPLSAETCARCNTEFVVGSRFCHVCGAQREPQGEFASSGMGRYMDFHAIREALGLTIGSLIAFVLGVACVGCAVATGLMYTATTLLDWQAVQIWRIEWLLAAVAAFLAGILLKRAG